MRGSNIWSWRPTVIRTTTEVILSIVPGVFYVCMCRDFEIFCWKQLPATCKNKLWAHQNSKLVNININVIVFFFPKDKRVYSLLPVLLLPPVGTQLVLNWYAVCTTFSCCNLHSVILSVTETLFIVSGWTKDLKCPANLFCARVLYSGRAIRLTEFI